jgi:starvation-inducible DNA-binding protein
MMKVAITDRAATEAVAATMVEVRRAANKARRGRVANGEGGDVTGRGYLHPRGVLSIGRRKEEGVEPQLGINETARKEIVGGLSHLLADTYTLYLKTHAYHWNVTGQMFRSLHLMFEEEYVELWNAVDDIAERIRSLGELAPGSYAELAELSAVPDEPGAPPALEMVRNLADGHETVARTARELVKLAEGAGDVATADLATARIEVHEKTAWMLRATAA